jgi:hypothetical protein
VSKYPWDRSLMGFLAYTSGEKKRLPYSKQKTQQHIFDKKAHGWNIKKGDPKYKAICPLCLHNDETGPHTLAMLPSSHEVLERGILCEVLKSH